MADFDNRGMARAQVGLDRAAAHEIDEGLRSYMLRVYNYMAIGLGITGVAAMVTYMMAVTQTATGLQLTGFGQLIYASAFKWVVMLAPLGMVFFLSARVQKMSVPGAQLAFWLFAGLMGLSLSSIFLVYTGASITRVFFVTAAAFGATKPVGLHDEEGHFRLGFVPVHGPDRHHSRLDREHISWAVRPCSSRFR